MGRATPGVDTPGKSWWGRAARLSNTNPISEQKCHFPHPFSDMVSKIHTWFSDMKLLRLERQQRFLKSHFEFAYHLSSLFLRRRIRPNTSMQNRRRLMIVRGGNRHVIIKLKSNGCGRAKRFSTPTPPPPPQRGDQLI